ncbi:MAG: penicillin-insensitive murein endopeptidase, partial [Methyloceanibacter sp.]
MLKLIVSLSLVFFWGTAAADPFKPKTATTKPAAAKVTAKPAAKAKKKPAPKGPPAKELFGTAPGPAPLAARAIGGYAKGCLAGGVPLSLNGPNWQVMRLSRNRNWG